jgi:hypothetical protein
MMMSSKSSLGLLLLAFFFTAWYSSLSLIKITYMDYVLGQSLGPLPLTFLFTACVPYISRDRHTITCIRKGCTHNDDVIEELLGPAAAGVLLHSLVLLALLNQRRVALPAAEHVDGALVTVPRQQHAERVTVLALPEVSTYSTHRVNMTVRRQRYIELRTSSG